MGAIPTVRSSSRYPPALQAHRDAQRRALLAPSTTDASTITDQDAPMPTATLDDPLPKSAAEKARARPARHIRPNPPAVTPPAGGVGTIGAVFPEVGDVPRAMLPWMAAMGASGMEGWPGAEGMDAHAGGVRAVDRDGREYDPIVPPPNVETRDPNSPSFLARGISAQGARNIAAAVADSRGEVVHPDPVGALRGHSCGRMRLSRLQLTYIQAQALEVQGFESE